MSDLSLFFRKHGFYFKYYDVQVQLHQTLEKQECLMNIFRLKNKKS